MSVECPSKAEAQVLFDEDYRAHISILNAKLERERHDVFDLRQEVAKLKERLLVKEYEL